MRAPKTLEIIAKKGDDLETLKALRQKIAKTIDESKSGRDIASLSRQLQIVMDQISTLEEIKRINGGETVLDIVRQKHDQKRLIPNNINDVNLDIDEGETVLDVVRNKAKARKKNTND